ncbi:MAG: hypothetical protein HKP30_16985 [Myxococcales bacterium]|nr:hypothetical protein [Myxococcales bacterium]
MRFLAAILVGSLFLAPAASAAPIATGVILTIEVVGLPAVSIAGATTVSVTGSTVSIPAGAVSLTAPLVVPVTGFTGIQSLSASSLGNLSGTFSLGGVTNQLPGEVCPTGPFFGGCTVGGGVGGAMGLTGVLDIVIVPSAVTFPLDLATLGVGLGGTAMAPFSVNAAGWTTRTGRIGTGSATSSRVGQGGGPLQLVTPTYVMGGGNLLPLFATLTLTNVTLPVPEPGGLLMLAAGCVGFFCWLAGRGRG